jgi:outer membrane biosynthesis protein TonB
MTLSKQQIQQQREAIDALYELVKDAPASERKDSAMAYCEGCIAACDLGLKVLNGKKAEAPKTEEAPKAEEPTVTEEPKAEEKPKRKRAAKKKEEPVEETLSVVDEAPAEEDDLDDLL